jgi:Flp pilus assembly pilin Flp
MSLPHYLRARFDSDDEGQATTEYALILLAAAVIAVLVITWATAGGGAGRIGDLFDSVFDGVLDKATSTPE